MDQAAETCERCEKVFCATCYDRKSGRCEPCADVLHLSDGDLLALIERWPGLILADLAERARTDALNARVNQHDPTRHIPFPGWYFLRVRALLGELHHDGSITCNHGHQRETDHGNLCEYRVTASGLRELRLAKGAA
ncbi:MAG TPA: hypothetical protein VJV75_04560 [Candidatus Polarisedimenticolia bacterium]|nr:hypothetical protein [Candidatus Polarisedimenticolia bacterium]